MKTYRRLYDRLWDFEHLYWAYRRARRGKRSKVPVAKFERFQEEELLALQQALKEETYLPGPYHSFYIHEPKRRLISAAPFRDRVVHHALVALLEPLWEPRFIYDSYANRKGKGTHRALERAQSFARSFPYVLQCDVCQFFPSIDHELLQNAMARLIRDERVLRLAALILESGQGVLSEAYDMVYFPGDDLMAFFRPRGLPIGNLTSQFWANVYLNPLDHFVKRSLKARGYVRYVDDFLLFSDSKSTLHRWRRRLIEFLAQWRLTLHAQRAQVYPVHTGIPFLGFRLFPEYRRLKRRNVVQARRRLRSHLRAYRRGEMTRQAFEASLRGWLNHARHAQTWRLRKDLLQEVRL